MYKLNSKFPTTFRPFSVTVEFDDMVDVLKDVEEIRAVDVLYARYGENNIEVHCLLFLSREWPQCCEVEESEVLKGIPG